MAIYGPLAGIDHYLEQEEHARQLDRDWLRWNQEWIALQERNNRKIEEIRQQIAQEKKEDTP